MTERETEKQAETAFRAVLHPHRSLSPRGFLILMLAVGFVSFATGLVFLIMGAWPIMGFFGLDVLLIYVAFKLNYRAGKAYELVEVTPEKLRLTQVDPWGAKRIFEFNTYWVRVRADEHHDGRIKLQLTSHGSSMTFGEHLNDDERRDFAKALANALSTARASAPA